MWYVVDGPHTASLSGLFRQRRRNACAGVLVSTVAVQSPKVVSIVAQVDTLASLSSPRAMASGAASFTFGPMTPTALLPRGNSFNGDKVRW
jgi:hypothetical protein